MEVVIINQEFSSTIEAQPVGFVVYIQKSGTNLSLASFCNETQMEVLEVMKILTASSGFKPEPVDAIGFFLFENNAKNFISTILSE